MKPADFAACLAAAQHCAGGLMLLAEEAPTPALHLRARLLAGDALLQRQQFELALEQFDTALALSAQDAHAQRGRAACLARHAAPAVRAPAAQPCQVLLFSGHMVDAADRERPRLPAAKLPAAERALRQVLDGLAVGAGDLLLTQGAAGGDLICAESCAARGARVQLLLPLAEPEFIARSILPSADGERWRTRYVALKSMLIDAPRVLPDQLGPGAPGTSPFERCNRWLLYSALAFGADRLHFVCLWDGSRGDGPGGTAHMVDEVKRRTGHVHWIDTRTLQ